VAIALSLEITLPSFENYFRILVDDCKDYYALQLSTPPVLCLVLGCCINNPSCYLLKIGSKQVKNSLAKSQMTLFLYKNLAFFVLTLVLNE